MHESACYGVIWDMDGTLVDTAELHFLAWQQVCQEVGRPFTRADFAAFLTGRLAEGRTVELASAKLSSSARKFAAKNHADARVVDAVLVIGNGEVNPFKSPRYRCRCLHLIDILGRIGRPRIAQERKMAERR